MLSLIFGFESCSSIMVIAGFPLSVCWSSQLWELCKGIDYNLQEEEGTADCASECRRWRAGGDVAKLEQHSLSSVQCVDRVESFLFESATTLTTEKLYMTLFFTNTNCRLHEKCRHNEYIHVLVWDLIVDMKDGVVGVLVEAPHNFLNFLYWIIGFPPCSPAPQWKFKLSKVPGSQLWLGRATSLRSVKVFLCQVEEEEGVLLSPVVMLQPLEPLNCWGCKHIREAGADWAGQH